MNEKQSHELQELLTLEAAGTLEDTKTERLEELKALQVIADKVIKIEKDSQTALAQKEHFRTKFEKEETARKELEVKLNAAAANGGKGEGLKVEDFIDISASLEGLDQKEKERVAREHKLTGKSLSEIRKDEDFLLWQSAYREKAEKEKQNIKPGNKQPDDNDPISLEDALKGKTLQEQADLLEQVAGYSIGKKSNTERVIIK